MNWQEGKRSKLNEGELMKQRIAFIRKDKGYSQDAFASKLNLSRNFINQLESGKKNPSDRTIADICRLFNVNEEWLRTGEGEIYSERDPEADLAHFTAKLFTKDRLKLIRESVGLSVDKFGEKLGVTRYAIFRLEKGERKITDQMVKSVCNTFDINEVWFRTGEGEMYIKKDFEADLAHFTAKLFTENSDSFKNRLISVLARLSESDWEVLERVANELTKKE